MEYLSYGQAEGGLSDIRQLDSLLQVPRHIRSMFDVMCSIFGLVILMLHACPAARRKGVTLP